MNSEHSESLPAEAELALAFTPQKVRKPLRILFELDARMAQIIAKTTEPMLGQMRLAWWRDVLGKPLDERPTGDAVLDGIGAYWTGRETALVSLIDGWEELIVAEELGKPQAKRFAEGRMAPFLALQPAESENDGERIRVAALRYVCADTAARLSDHGEKAVFLQYGSDLETPKGKLPRELKGLGVLEALARRAMKRGGRPLMEGRGASLAALRASIFPG